MTAVTTAAISPVTSLRVASSYTSRFSSYVSSCWKFLYRMFFSYVPSCCHFLCQIFLQLRPFMLSVLTKAVRPVPSLRVVNFYSSCFSSYFSSCCQFFFIPVVSPVTSLPVSSSNTSRFSSHVSSCYQVLHQPFLQLPLFVVTGQVP